ncbi:GNAT family N-acetyltransferase [Luteimonas saliphila]|uniref:GNAT family N-acetyltransferase n=1 Tax=Luteimonas saliphila TaxID=2804919 RepID=UPI00192E2938|nr:GNAT family N-acetyltransferase [Luteimonas saliphila]
MQSLLQIRCLSEADASVYYALRRRSTEGLVAAVEAQVFREIEAGPNGIAAKLSGYVSEGTRVWGAYSGDTLIAAAALTREYHATHCGLGVLWGVYVLPRYRGTPASRMLMESIIDDCRNDGDIRQIRASCSYDNVAGQRFLQRLGFEATTATKGDALCDGPLGMYYLQLQRHSDES